MIEKYIRLIQKEARKASKMLGEARIISYNLDDLIQEGVVKFLQVERVYDYNKAQMSTVLTIALKNHYLNILKAESRRIMASIEFLSYKELQKFSCAPNYLSNIFIAEIKSILTPEECELLDCLLELDSKFDIWLERREWAREALKLRYRNKGVKSLIEEYKESNLDVFFEKLRAVVV